MLNFPGSFANSQFGFNMKFNKEYLSDLPLSPSTSLLPSSPFIPLCKRQVLHGRVFKGIFCQSCKWTYSRICAVCYVSDSWFPIQRNVILCWKMKYYLLLLSLVVFFIPSNRTVQLISDTAPYITEQESKKHHERENMKRDFTSLSYFLKLTASSCDNNPQPERRVGTLRKEGNSTNGFIWWEFLRFCGAAFRVCFEKQSFVFCLQVYITSPLFLSCVDFRKLG